MLPIRPSEALIQKLSNALPERVIRIWNRAIAEAYGDSYASIQDDDIVTALATEHSIPERSVPPAWLAVSELYTAAGWDVKIYNGRTEFRRAKR